MFFKVFVISCLLSSLTLAAAQTRSVVLNGVTQSSTVAAPASQGARSDDVAALRDDIRKMRLLVQQMDNNLTFVSDTQSPLKHQFELEIQMWRMVIGQMERRADAMERH
jgi:hypothetical protein